MIHITVDNTGGKPAYITDYIFGVYPKADPDAILRAQENHDIFFNGKATSDDVFVSDGDLISLNLFFFHLGLPPVLDILYEDENFIAIEKMPGVPSFDENRNGVVNVYDMALEYMLQKGEYHVESLTVPYLCYVLSEFAGGILLIAKHEDAYRYIVAAISQRKILMTYEAIVAGRPEMAVDELMHYMDSTCHIYSQPVEGAFPIVTRYKCLINLSQYTKIEIRPVTYNRFQVYAHLAFIGHPILGDTLFGNKRVNRRANMDYEAYWLKRLRFSIGEGEPFNYLNHIRLEMKNLYYPNHIIMKGKKKLTHESN